MDDETSNLQWNPDAETLISRISQTQGVKTWGGSFGNSGQVLTSQGSSTAWSWTTPFSGDYDDLSGKPTIPENANVKITVKTSNENGWTLTSGYKYAEVYCVGGGGGSGASYGNTDNNSNEAGSSGGGGGGGVAWRMYNVSALDQGANLTIGAAGNKGTNGGAGSAGGNTIFDPIESGTGSVSASGGGGSSAANRNTTAGGSAGQFSGGFMEKPGKVGNTGVKGSNVDGGQPGYQNEHFFTADASFFNATSNRGRGATGKNNSHNEGAWYDGNDGNPGMIVILEYR